MFGMREIAEKPFIRRPLRDRGCQMIGNGDLEQLSIDALLKLIPNWTLPVLYHPDFDGELSSADGHRYRDYPVK